MLSANFKLPEIKNEPIKNYLKGSEEREKLLLELERQKKLKKEIPIYVGSKRLKEGSPVEIHAPHDHNLILGYYYNAEIEQVSMALNSSRKIAHEWASFSFDERAAIFLKAADLIAKKYRYVLNAATMLGQSKVLYQAEIDSACELIDFLRLNVKFMEMIYNNQPLSEHDEGQWSRTDYRPLEGFVFALTPFNFTAISGNLPISAAMMGNVILWKPSRGAVLSSNYIMEILLEAGLPEGVINMVPSKGEKIGNFVLDQPDFAGLHFTGSTGVFNSMMKRVGDNIARGIYKNYPRMVGETGGKDFIVATPKCDIKALSTALVRGAFEYQGQKCSAASRAYLPAENWDEIKKEMKKMLSQIKQGDVSDLSNFMGAVIDKKSFDNIAGYIEYAKKSDEAEIVLGGKYDDSKGYFISPTVILTTNPKFKSMQEEIFGPVLTIYLYPEKEFEQTLHLIDETSPYALTGAIFSSDRAEIRLALDILRYAAGNFYINDKPTGAVVGKQPFGGARMSGTNDKSGSFLNLLRWTNVRTIKENFLPPTGILYPYMTE